jgi:hypothetical protein
VSQADGKVVGLTKIVDHGANAKRYNIVILGDGYRQAELAGFARDAQAFATTLQTTDPYRALWAGINVFRVDIASTDSGADDPKVCGDGSAGSGLAARTYFDATFCGDAQIRRLLTCNVDLARATALAQVPQMHMTIVIVNSTQYGGSGGQVAVFSRAPGASEIALHEMGHTAFGFADEYGYYQGCGTGEAGHDRYGGGEPVEPNVTANKDPLTVKWRRLLTQPQDGFPTTANADCGDCDNQANPKAAGYVGLYEGARYFHCSCYRGSFDCRMRALGSPFCGVCSATITAALQPFLAP